MKKAGIFILALAFLGFLSCQKKQNWHCACGPTGTSNVTYTTSISNATKGNAADLCNRAAGNTMPSGTYACQVTPE